MGCKPRLCSRGPRGKGGTAAGVGAKPRPCRLPPPAPLVTYNRLRMAYLPPDTGELVLRLLAAAAFGAGIGIDREVRGKPAGMRTHALVSLGAALVIIVTVRGGPPGD